MKKLLSIFLIIFLLSNNIIVFSSTPLLENNLYFLDRNNNWKIDTLEIEYNKALTWVLNTSKLFLYSSSWWLSENKLDSVYWSNIFSSYSLSWNSLILDIIEQNKIFTWLIVNNTTNSHLRLKTNAWIWIHDDIWDEIKLLYTSSFNNYKNVFYKENVFNNSIIDTITNTWTLENNYHSWNTLSWVENITNTWIIDNLYQSWIIINSWNINNIQDIYSNSWSEILINSWIVTNSWILENVYQSWNIFSWTENINLQNEDLIKIFSWKIIFQNPTYLNEKDKDVENYNCSSTQTDCRVNYNLNIDFWSWFESILSSKYNCEWNFWFNEYIEEKYKCNPNTITYPEWEYTVNFKIYEISNPNNYFSKNIKIINKWYKEPENIKTIYVWWWGVNTKILEYMYIETPKINIQSWLDDNNFCKTDCSINLSYKPKNTKESCLWDFSWWDYEYWTEKKCNPGYVKYKLWEYKIKLKVYESWNENNYKENILEIKNIGDKLLLNKKINNYDLSSSWITNQSSWSIKDIKLNEKYNNLKISKVLPNPSWKEEEEYIEITYNWSWDILLDNCELDDKINWWSDSYLIDSWTVLNENWFIKFYRKNTHISLNNSSWEEVNLICDKNIIDKISWTFDIKEDIIITKESYVKKELYSEQIKNTNILSELINDKILDNDEIKIINNNFTQKIKKLKSWVKIYWKTFPNTKIIIELKKLENEIWLFFIKAYANNNYYQTISDEEWKYEIKLDKINIWEFEIKNYLKLDEKSSIKLDKTNNLDIDNDYIDYVKYLKKEKITPNIIPLKANITLQKIAKNISVKSNKITCKNTDYCNINFDWRKSTWDIKKYYWDFWNWEFSNKKNPNSVKYNTWKYIISLKVIDGNDENETFFIVDVLWKIKKETKVIKEKTKKTLSKIEKINIVKKVDASNTSNSKNKDLWINLYLSTLILILFFVFWFIILRKNKII